LIDSRGRGLESGRGAVILIGAEFGSGSPPSRPETPSVPRYRTEIVIPDDRYVSLQLPRDLPAGRAVVVVTIEEPADLAPDEDLWPEAEDIEWWEEFGDDTADDQARPLRHRLDVLEV
jgi:hypothetical protein